MIWLRSCSTLSSQGNKRYEMCVLAHLCHKSCVCVGIMSTALRWKTLNQEREENGTEEKGCKLPRQDWMKSSGIGSFGGARVARPPLCERFKGDWCVPAGCNATIYTKSTVLSTYMHADNTKGVVHITQVQRASDSCQWEHVRLRLIIGLSSTCSGTLEGTEGDRKSMGDIERMWEQRI